MNAQGSDWPAARAAGRDRPASLGGPAGGYALGVLASLAASAATSLSWPMLRPTPWAFFLAAVMASAWLAGRGPSLVAIGLSALLGNVFFLDPYGAPSVSGRAAIATLVFLGISGFIAHLASARRRSEASERRQRSWFEATVAGMGDALLATDDRGLVRLMNPVAEALTGWTGDEARGRPVAEVFRLLDEVTRRPVEGPVPRALRGVVVAEPVDGRVLAGRDGSGRPIEATAAPIRDDRGAVQGVVLVFRDVTERRAAASADARVVAIRKALGSSVNRGRGAASAAG
jgi:PAS domain S-box-containing protein